MLIRKKSKKCLKSYVKSNHTKSTNSTVKKTTLQKLINAVRQSVPLSARQAIGPVLAKTLHSYRNYTGAKKPQVMSINETLRSLLSRFD